MNEMMKKISLWMISIAAVLASCSQEDALQSSDNRDGVTVISAVVESGMKTRAATTEDDTPSRCLLQVFSGTNAETSVTEIITGTGTPEGGYTFPVSGLEDGVQYTFLFWADNGTYDATDLKAVKVSSEAKTSQTIGIAYSCMMQKTKAEIASATAELTHAVAKITLQTSGALEAGKTASMTYPTYEEFNVYNETANSSVASSYVNSSAEAVTIPEGENAAAVFSVYALGIKGAADKTVTIAYDGRTETEEIANLPIAPNKHITLVGDVSKIGITTFSASISDSWDAEEDKNFPAGYTLSEDGTTMNISHANGLKYLADLVNSGSTGIRAVGTITTIELENDIDLSQFANWTPIGTLDQPFNATFKGNGHTIKGLTISHKNGTDQKEWGLFGVTQDAGIENLTLEGNITLGRYVTPFDKTLIGDDIGEDDEYIKKCYGIGGFAGKCIGTTTFKGCHNKVEITVFPGGNSVCVGGILGVLGRGFPATFTACYNTASISNEFAENAAYVAGILGYATYNVLAADPTYDQYTACYSSACVKGCTQIYTRSSGIVDKSAVGEDKVVACYWSQVNDFPKGGLNALNKIAIQVTGDVTWATACEAMNTALSGSGYSYEENTGSDAGSVPLVLVTDK